MALVPWEDEETPGPAGGKRDIGEFPKETVPWESERTPGVGEGTVLDYPVEAGKNFIRGAKSLPASALKGSVAASRAARYNRAEWLGQQDPGPADDSPAERAAFRLRRHERGASGAPWREQQRQELEEQIASEGPIRDSPAWKASESIENFGTGPNGALSPRPGFEPGKSLWADVWSGAGSMAAGIGTSMIPVVGPAAAPYMYLTSGVGETADRIDQAAVQDERAALRAAVPGGALAGATDLVDLLLPQLGSTGKAVGLLQKIGKAGIHALKAAAFEGGQEGLQEYLQNLVEKQVWNPNKDVSENVPRSALIGALVGAFAGPAAHSWEERQERKADEREKLAAKIQAAAEKTDTNPTDEQKESGKYDKGKVNVDGITVAIENPRGSVRSGVNKETGEEWQSTLPDHYGYITHVTGEDGKKVAVPPGHDGDPVDVYMGDEPVKGKTYLITQVDPDSKEPDEHKVMLGYPDAQSAIGTYAAAFSDGRGLERIGGIHEVDDAGLKSWLTNPDRALATDPQWTALSVMPRSAPVQQREQLQTPEAPKAVEVPTDDLYQHALAEIAGRKDISKLFLLSRLKIPLRDIDTMLARMQSEGWIGQLDERGRFPVLTPEGSTPPAAETQEEAIDRRAREIVRDNPAVPYGSGDPVLDARNLELAREDAMREFGIHPKTRRPLQVRPGVVRLYREEDPTASNFNHDHKFTDDPESLRAREGSYSTYIDLPAAQAAKFFDSYEGSYFIPEEISERRRPYNGPREAEAQTARDTAMQSLASTIAAAYPHYNPNEVKRLAINLIQARYTFDDRVPQAVRDAAKAARAANDAQTRAQAETDQRELDKYDEKAQAIERPLGLPPNMSAELLKRLRHVYRQQTRAEEAVEKAEANHLSALNRWTNRQESVNPVTPREVTETERIRDKAREILEQAKESRRAVLREMGPQGGQIAESLQASGRDIDVTGGVTALDDIFSDPMFSDSEQSRMTPGKTKGELRRQLVEQAYRLGVRRAREGRAAEPLFDYNKDFGPEDLSKLDHFQLKAYEFGRLDAASKTMQQANRRDIDVTKSSALSEDAAQERSRIVSNALEQLEDGREGRGHPFWVNFPSGLQFYIRSGTTERMPRVLEIANVTGEGQPFEGFLALREFEKQAIDYGYDGVRMENVMNERLIPFFKRAGYSLEPDMFGNPPSFVRKLPKGNLYFDASYPYTFEGRNSPVHDEHKNEEQAREDDRRVWEAKEKFASDKKAGIEEARAAVEAQVRKEFPKGYMDIQLDDYHEPRPAPALMTRDQFAAANPALADRYKDPMWTHIVDYDGRITPYTSLEDAQEHVDQIKSWEPTVEREGLVRMYTDVFGRAPPGYSAASPDLKRLVREHVYLNKRSDKAWLNKHADSLNRRLRDAEVARNNLVWSLQQKYGDRKSPLADMRFGSLNIDSMVEAMTKAARFSLSRSFRQDARDLQKADEDYQAARKAADDAGVSKNLKDEDYGAKTKLTPDQRREVSDHLEKNIEYSAASVLASSDGRYGKAFADINELIGILRGQVGGGGGLLGSLGNTKPSEEDLARVKRWQEVKRTLGEWQREGKKLRGDWKDEDGNPVQRGFSRQVMQQVFDLMSTPPQSGADFNRRLDDTRQKYLDEAEKLSSTEVQHQIRLAVAEYVRVMNDLKDKVRTEHGLAGVSEIGISSWINNELLKVRKGKPSRLTPSDMALIDQGVELNMKFEAFRDVRSPQAGRPLGTETAGLTTIHTIHESRLNGAEKAIFKEIQKIVDRMAPLASVRMAHDLRSIGAHGVMISQPPYASQLRHVIYWALASYDSVGTVRHELLHFFKASGLIRPNEWNILTKAAQVGQWGKEFNIEGRYPNATPELKLEEAIAERFGQWNRPTKDLSAVDKIFRRLNEFKRRVAARLKQLFGKDLSVEDIFTMLESGQIGRRAPGVPVRHVPVSTVKAAPPLRGAPIPAARGATPTSPSSAPPSGGGAPPRGRSIPIGTPGAPTTPTPPAGGGGRPRGGWFAPSQEQRGRYGFNRIYTRIKDELNPIRVMRNALLGRRSFGRALYERLTWRGARTRLAHWADPYALARLTRGTIGLAEHWINYGTFSYADRTRRTGAGLREILRPVQANLDRFLDYALARRALELHGRNIDPGITAADAAAYVNWYDAHHPEFYQAAQRLVEFQRRMLAYVRDAGLISDQAFQDMVRLNQDYIPFFRLMDQGGGGPTAGGSLKVKQPTQRIRGSDLQRVDPLESVIKNTYMFLALAERNRALRALGDLAEASPRGVDLLPVVRAPVHAVNVTSQEMERWLRAQGLPTSFATDMTIFRPNAFRPTRDTISYYEDGRRVVRRTADPDLAEAVSSMDSGAVNMLVKLIAIPAKTLRAGAVFAPEFIARNPVRDAMTALILNMGFGGNIPVYDMLRGLGSIMGRNQHYQDWLRSGAARSALVGMDRDYVQDLVESMRRPWSEVMRNPIAAAARGLNNVVHMPYNMVRHPIRSGKAALDTVLKPLQIMSELMENATRIGKFRRARLAGADIFEAGMAAREITLDFQRLGSQMHSMNAITAFFNPQVEGVDMMFRAFGQRPLATTAKLMMAITIPSILLWLKNYKDDRYKDIPQWQKDLFWIVMTDKWKEITSSDAEDVPSGYKKQEGDKWYRNDGTIYRIPKPFELGVLFGSVPERILDHYVGKNPDAYKNIVKSVQGAMVPTFLPNAVVPPFEQFANRSFFTERPLVPEYLKNVDPEYQQQPFTSETAKLIGAGIAKIGSMLGSPHPDASSPLILENYIRGWTGGLGMHALDLSDKMLEYVGATEEKVKPTPTLSDLPLIKAFVVRNPSVSAQPIQDFYEKYNERKRNKGTMRYLNEVGEEDEAKRIEQERAMENDERTHRFLGSQIKLARGIYRDKTVTPEEKRELLDKLYLQMINVARGGLARFRETEKKPEPKPAPGNLVPWEQ